MKQMLHQEYLGQILSHNGKSGREAHARKRKAETKFFGRMGVWKTTKLHRRQKGKLYQAVIECLLYGCQTWRRDEAVLRKINGSNARMVSVFSGKTEKEEAAEETQTYSIKQDMRWRTRKLLIKVLHITCKEDATNVGEAAGTGRGEHTGEGDAEGAEEEPNEE